MSNKTNQIKSQENILNISKENLLEIAGETDKDQTVERRILYVTRPIAPPWDEASKNFAYHLAKNVAKINPRLEIHLLTKGLLPDLPRNIIQHSIYTSSEKDFSFSQKIRSLWWQWRLKNKFDLVHYFFTPSKLNTLILKAFLYPKRSHTIQTIASLREDINNDLEIKENVFADIPITYSRYSRDKLKQLGFQNAQHIYPGIDLSLYSPRDKNEELLTEFNFSQKDFVISFTGEYTRLGGMDNVVEAMRELTKKIPEIKLLLIVRIKNQRDEANKKLVIKKLKKYNILNRVAFADNLDFTKWTVSDLYNLSDIILFTVHNMNGKFDVPLVIPEAMACKKPVILSDLPILREFTDNDHAILVKRNDSSEIVRSVFELYTDSRKRDFLAERGLKYVRKNFDIEYIAERYNQIYQEI